MTMALRSRWEKFEKALDSHPKLLKILAAVSLFIAIVLFIKNIFYLFGFTMDDAFIYLRYADNLAFKGVLDFNLDGEMNEGFTTFLYTVLLAGLRYFGVDGLYAIKAVGILSVAGVLCFSSLALQKISKKSLSLLESLAIFAVLFLSFPSTPFHAVTGMETMLFTFVLSAMVYFWLRAKEENTVSNFLFLGITCFISGICRPDGNLPALIFLADLFLSIKNRKSFLASICLSYFLPGAVYFFWRYTQYGLLFPAPFYVKVGTHPGLNGVKEVKNYYKEILALTLLSPVFFLFRRSNLKALAVIIILYSCFYLKPVHNMGYESRFLFPLTPLIIAAGASVFIRNKNLTRFVLVLNICIALVMTISRYKHEYRDWIAYENGMDQTTIRLAQDLAGYKSLVGDRWIATVDDGAIPYFSGLPTLDLYGLNNKHIATKGYDSAYVESKNIDIMILVSTTENSYTRLLENEQKAFDDAMKWGFHLLATYKFNDNYYYFIFGKSTEAKDFFSKLLKEKPSLIPNPNLDQLTGK